MAEGRSLCDGMMDAAYRWYCPLSRQDSMFGEVPGVAVEGFVVQLEVSDSLDSQ